MKENTVHISTGISKLGEIIPSVNLPPDETCRPDAPCKRLCYARHGRFLFPNVQETLRRNWKIYTHDPSGFFKQIDGFLQMVPYRYFRWFSAGDIPHIGFFERMCKLARRHKETKFLCFTKKYDIVNHYVESGCRIPANLKIIFSRWGAFPCENPHNFPESWVQFKGKSNDEIPSHAKLCSGNCGSCVNTKGNCWELKKGQAVYFPQH